MPRRKGKDERAPDASGVQGEGDYISGRRYQKDVEEFTRTHDTEQLAREAEPKSEAERREMAEAEKKGKARAKGRKPERG
jgi:hypothetical protein